MPHAPATITEEIAGNVVGEFSDSWWLLAVPVGLLLVPIVGIVSLVALMRDRRA